jgi:hypothetical protein
LIECQECKSTENDVNPRLLVCEPCIHTYWLTIYGTPELTEKRRAAVELNKKMYPAPGSRSR